MTEKRFSLLNQPERLTWLVDQGILSTEDIDILQQSSNPHIMQLSDQFIENSIGSFWLALGIVPNVHLNDKIYTVPMAVEETSIIAAASYIAKWIRKSGTLSTSRKNRHIIGQVQLNEVKDFEKLERFIKDSKQEWIDKINKIICPGMFVRGGGAIDVLLRRIPMDTDRERAVIHLLFDPCDAMGANIINQACEYLKTDIEARFKDVSTIMAILSNLNDHAVVKATLTIEDIEPDLAKKIETGSMCALTDPYRAATHNKGIFNGIDPVLIATGNDWRAAEAAAHAYACRTGTYMPFSKWERVGKDLVGTIEMPMVTAIAGGVTKVHPLANIAFKILNVESANELDQLVVAMGLVQNLAAVKALTTEGISCGHMRLHIKNYVALLAKTPDEAAYAEEQLKHKLLITKRISMADAQEAIDEFRSRKIAI